MTLETFAVALTSIMLSAIAQLLIKLGMSGLRATGLNGKTIPRLSVCFTRLGRCRPAVVDLSQGPAAARIGGILLIISCVMLMGRTAS